MAKKKAAPKKKSAAHRTTKKAGKKRNPQPLALQKRNPTRKKKRNPDITSLLGTPKSLAVQGVSGLLSAVVTRQLPQMIMGSANTGWKGYAANAGAGLAATVLAAKLISPEAGKAALVGASVIILDRILTEKFSPLGQYLVLSGSGDATATGTLGTIADGYFIHPTVIDAQGRPVIPHEITDAAIQAVLNKYPGIAAPAAPMQKRLAGAGGVGPRRLTRDRFQSRWA